MGIKTEAVVEADDLVPIFAEAISKALQFGAVEHAVCRELKRRKVVDGVLSAAVDELIARDEQQGRPAPVVRTGEHGRRIGAVALDREQQAVGIVCQRDLQGRARLPLL